MHAFLGIHWMQIVATYGYAAVFLIIMLESAGLPLPGETVLVTAAIFAGRTHALELPLVIAAAAAAAIIGDNIGFWVGREAGVPLLRRYGGYVGIGPERIRLGEYVFRRHGGKIVFFGRFVAVLRAFAAFLAGANKYPWSHFLIWNAAGGVIWATAFGIGGYVFGRALHKVTGPIGIAGLGLAVVAVIAGWRFMRKHEAELQAKADAELGTGSEARPALNQNMA